MGGDVCTRVFETCKCFTVQTMKQWQLRTAKLAVVHLPTRTTGIPSASATDSRTTVDYTLSCRRAQLRGSLVCCSLVSLSPVGFLFAVLSSTTSHRRFLLPRLHIGHRSIALCRVAFAKPVLPVAPVCTAPCSALAKNAPIVIHSPSAQCELLFSFPRLYLSFPSLSHRQQAPNSLTQLFAFTPA